MRSSTRDLDGGLGPGTFQAYRSAAGFTVATGSSVLFELEELDTDDWYDADTGIFLPKLAGVYHMSWAVNAGEAAASGNYWTAPLYKNGVQHRNGQMYISTGAAPYPISVGSSDVYADGIRDAFYIGVLHNMTGNRLVAGGSYATYWTGHLVRATGR